MSDLTWGDIKASLRIEEAMDAMGVRERYRRNHGIWCSCPLPSHSGMDKSPSFSIKEEQFVWHCFACDDGGSFPYLVQQMVGLDTWQEALDWLVEYSDADPADEDAFLRQIEGYLSRPERLYLQRGTTTLPYYSEAVLEPYRGSGGVFWEGRGLNPQGIDAFKLGFDPERTRGDYTGPAGLVPHYFGGKLVGYQERWIDHGSEGFPKHIPKYTNSGDFPRKDTLFNYDRAAASDWPVVVVESVITVIRLWQVGWPSVATFGGSINEQQMRLLSSFRQGVMYAPDNDSTGEKAARTLITGLGSKVPVEIIPPPDGHKADLGDLDDEALVAQLEKAVPGFLY